MYRIRYEGYIEAEYKTRHDAIKDFIEELDNLEESDLTVEIFNDQTWKWEKENKNERN